MKRKTHQSIRQQAETIKRELEELKKIAEILSMNVMTKDDKLLNFKQTADYLGLSHSYLYKLTSQKMIPCYRPLGRLFFFKHELDAWVKGKEHTEPSSEENLELFEEVLEKEEDPP